MRNIRGGSSLLFRSTPVAIRVAQARQICTPAELDLVLQSTTRQIGSLDPKQLRASIRRARTLRDKWRDRAAAQTRDTKNRNPEKLGEANARSNDKAQLFDEALSRFEKRLSRVDGASGGSAAKAKPAKSVRTSEHRAERASTRSTLGKQSKKLSTNGAASASTAATSPSTASAAVTADHNGAAKPSSKPTTAKKGATSKVSAKRKGPPKRKAPPRSGSRSTTALPAAAAAVAPGLAAAAMAAGRDGAEGGAQAGGKAKKRNPQANATLKSTAVKPAGGHRMTGKVASPGRRSQAKRGSR